MASNISKEQQTRKDWLAALSLAGKPLLQEVREGLAYPSDTQELRKPEVGLAMVRGRTGGTGNPFNLGEITVTRCVVTLQDSGTGNQILGVACITGRDKQHAKLVAQLDAIFQDSRLGTDAQNAVLPILKLERDAIVAKQASKAAATKVDFFTMERGH